MILRTPIPIPMYLHQKGHPYTVFYPRVTRSLRVYAVFTLSIESKSPQQPSEQSPTPGVEQQVLSLHISSWAGFRRTQIICGLPCFLMKKLFPKAYRAKGRSFV